MAKLVLAPGEAASQLGISVPALVALVRRHRYDYTELVHGGRPGDRGRNRWGLTPDQVRAIVRGQARQLPLPPRDPPPASPTPSALPCAGPSRLRRGPGCGLAHRMRDAR